MTDWQKQRSERDARLNTGSRYASGKVVPPESAKVLLEAVIRPGDRVCLEGDNQKQADFLAEALASVDLEHLFLAPIVRATIGAYAPVGAGGEGERPRLQARPPVKLVRPTRR